MTHSPRAFPREMSLPWAPLRIRANATHRVGPVARARGSVCGKDAGESTSLVPGISAIARSRNAAARSTAGRQRGDRPSDAKIPRSEPNMPRPKAHAANGPKSHHGRLTTHNGHLRVVTRLTLFFSSVMRPAGLPRIPGGLAPQPGTLLWNRLPKGLSQRP